MQSRTLLLDRITLLWFITIYVVGRDFAITDSVSAVNSTTHNRNNSAEIICYNPFIRNNNSLNPFIITNNDLSIIVFIFYINFIRLLIFEIYFNHLLALIVDLIVDFFGVNATYFCIQFD